MLLDEINNQFIIRSFVCMMTSVSDKFYNNGFVNGSDSIHKNTTKIRNGTNGTQGENNN